jgi:hypothetical protein
MVGACLKSTNGFLVWQFGGGRDWLDGYAGAVLVE